MSALQYDEMFRAMIGPRTMALVGRFCSQRTGAVSVEFGFLILPMLVLIFGVMQFGMIIWTQTSMQYSVERAARCASVNKTLCGTSTQIQQYAATQMVAPGASSGNFTYTAVTCGNQVTASFTYNYLFQMFLPASVTLTAKSCYPT